jgi:uncharacterized damage-inducible protein DinB
MSTNIGRSLQFEFDHEMENTRKVLARVPEGKDSYRPHAKSMTLSRLAGHVVELPIWGWMTLSEDEFDVSPGAGKGFERFVFTSTAGALERFDREVEKARGLLATTTDEQMMQTWTLKNGDQTIFAMPKAAVFRSFFMNHLIHHRAQLGVYLRLNDVPVPGLYGPSADEQ